MVKYRNIDYIDTFSKNNLCFVNYKKMIQNSYTNLYIKHKYEMVFIKLF